MAEMKWVAGRGLQPITKTIIQPKVNPLLYDNLSADNFNQFTKSLTPNGYKAGLVSNRQVTSSTPKKVSIPTKVPFSKVSNSTNPPGLATPPPLVPATNVADTSTPQGDSTQIGTPMTDNLNYLNQMQQNPTVGASGGQVLSSDSMGPPIYEPMQYQTGITPFNQQLTQEGQYTNLAGEGTVGLGGTPESSSWIDGLSNYQTLQGAAGLGGLAMNAYGMFGSGGTMDVNKKNIQLMDQQIMNNASEMARRNKYRSDITKSGLGA